MPPTPPDPLLPVRRLIVVDDDRLFLQVFAENLRAAGYLPLCFDDARAGLAALMAGVQACACVLDLDMPELDGLAFLRTLHQHGIMLPVVFVTSHNNPIFEEQALRDGAVEFIDKSRGPAIILHRIDLATRPRERAAIAQQAASDIVQGRLKLRCQTRRTFWNGVEVPLSRSEFAVVQCLVAATGSDVGYRQIYDAIKGEGFVAGVGEDGYRANVRAMIKRIRRKFEQVDPSFAALGTYPGFGYRWYDPDAATAGKHVD